MLYQLKCKIGALAAEARFIKTCERGEKKEARRIDKKYGGIAPDAPEKYSSLKRRDRALSMRLHRIGTVRYEARSAQLAYAFLRGKSYRMIEQKCHPRNGPNWLHVEEIALRFSPEDARALKQRFAEWKDAKLTPDEKRKLELSRQRAEIALSKKRLAAKEKRELKQSGGQMCI